MNVIIDSGASRNLMSEEVFDLVTGGSVKLLACNKRCQNEVLVLDLVTGGSVKLLACKKRVFAYASVEPLQLKGKCNLNVCIPQTQKSFKGEFYVTQGKAATLLGRDASELLGVLRVGIPVNNR